MLIFYGESEGRPNVPAERLANVDVGDALEVFRNLKCGQGFVGIVLEPPFALHLLPDRNGVRMELLDRSKPATVSVDDADSTTVERFIEAAGNGQDVVQLARQSLNGWDFLDLSQAAKESKATMPLEEARRLIASGCENWPRLVEVAWTISVSSEASSADLLAYLAHRGLLLRTFFWSYFRRNWHRMDFGRLISLMS